MFDMLDINKTRCDTPKSGIDGEERMIDCLLGPSVWKRAKLGTIQECEERFEGAEATEDAYRPCPNDQGHIRLRDRSTADSVSTPPPHHAGTPCEPTSYPVRLSVLLRFSARRCFVRRHVRSSCSLTRSRKPLLEQERRNCKHVLLYGDLESISTTHLPCLVP